MNTHIKNAADKVSRLCGQTPDIALILGSGLNSLADDLQNPVTIPYGDIPGFPISTAPGHVSELVVGGMEGHQVMVFRGRFHFYEGYDMAQIAYPIRMLKTLECQQLLLTNAAGGINKSFNIGDLMLITDHINLTGQNPLIGENDKDFGLRFPDMSYCWSDGLTRILQSAADNTGIKVRKGVYTWFTGPSFETPAEIRMARIMGGDAAGMSTVPEAIVAAHCGIRTAGISCITNMAAGILDQPITQEEVMETGRMAKAKFAALIREFLRILPIKPSVKGIGG